VALAPRRARVGRPIERRPLRRGCRGFVEYPLKKGRMHVDAHLGPRRARGVTVRGDADEARRAKGLQKRRAAAVAAARHAGIGGDMKCLRVDGGHPGGSALPGARMPLLVDAEPHHARRLPHEVRRQRRKIQRHRRDGRVLGEDQRADIVHPSAPSGVQAAERHAHALFGERLGHLGREHHRERLRHVVVLHAVRGGQDDPRGDQRARARDRRGVRGFVWLPAERRRVDDRPHRRGARIGRSAHHGLRRRPERGLERPPASARRRRRRHKKQQGD
jgi:hypothetical protein